MHLWPFLIPVAFFAAAFTFGAVAIWFIAKRTKVSQTETQYGPAVHVETPLATFDVHPEGKLDPRLARIPVYPGAMPQNSVGAEAVSEVHIGSRVLQEISASYWTPDDEHEVWDFYRQQLPDWPRNLDEAQGKELIRSQSDCVLLVRVTPRHERTVIDTCIKPAGYPNVR